MSDLRIDRDLGAKILGAISILALLAGIVFLCWPKPTAATIIRADQKQADSLAAKKQDEDAKAAVIEKAVKARTWACSQAEIGPSALASMTHLAKVHRLKLATFRPQKTVDLKGLTELPFLMAVEGSYLDLAGFIRELEKPETKLVPSMLQLSAGDQTTDKVTASITVAAFTEPQPVKPASGAKADKKAKGGQNGKTL